MMPMRRRGGDDPVTDSSKVTDGTRTVVYSQKE